MRIEGLKLHIATIVDEPENSPTVLIAQSEGKLLAKLKACPDLDHLHGLNAATSCDAVTELWDNARDEGMLYEYSGVFLSTQEL